ncbi:hypothetical protein [Mucilaginibacter sp. SJ]|uniref:hypothetical protein n=1 Tax=Mucilaginibacter sp. SJ TaxID=3029053 RepID=UPI0023A983DB|nr:hypothetical protein [Mucilaginibacter sp. SJ]WDZ99969.1 hypothetical protein MusilaSJ_21165 [Mucilaginibacter sp. SJ]
MQKNNQILILVIPGVLALVGTLLGGMLQGYWNSELSRQKYQSDLVLKALESNSAEERLQTLKLLVHTNLIKESSVRDSIVNYIIQKQKDPSSIPQIKPATSVSLDAPIVDNARVYLLAGNKKLTNKFNDIEQQLTNAGFKVMGARNIFDVGRPDSTEVRYFNADDQLQANKVSEFLHFKYGQSYVAKYYKDNKAKSGYIEIWLGR